MPKRAANSKPKVVAKKPRTTKSHKLPDALPDGEILRDILKKEWKLGKGIGEGGFGLIYLASDNLDKPVAQDAPYVVKIEPFCNGPLFCELAFYQRAAKEDMIKEWMSSKKLKSLGMPRFIASGIHTTNGTKYRFMVMQRFGTDLQKLFESNGKQFSQITVFKLALRLLDVLEYIHNKDYVHADIKASNLLIGYNSNEVFLVDYGLAYKYTSDGVHKTYVEDPRRAHDGTIEFTSRDAHSGVLPSRRGDLEILGYCLLQWLCGTLPWEDNLTNKDYVKKEKIVHMNNIPQFLKKCSQNGPIPDEFQKYLQYVNSMEYSTLPDYDKVRKLFRSALQKRGAKDDGKVDLNNCGAIVKSPQKTKKRKVTQGKDEMDSKRVKKTEKVPRKQTPKKVISSPQVGMSKENGISPKRNIPTVMSSPMLLPNSASSNRKSRSVMSPAVNAISPATVQGSARKRKVRRQYKQVSTSTSATQTTPGLKKRQSIKKRPVTAQKVKK